MRRTKRNGGRIVVRRGNKWPQMPGQPGLPLKPGGEPPPNRRSEEESPRTREARRPGTEDLMESVLSKPNLQQALKRVLKNKGSPGVDGMRVEDLPAYLQKEWAGIAE